MKKDKWIKVLLFNLLLSVVNFCVFSPALLAFSIFGAPAFITALGVTVIALSIALFFYGNYRLLLAPPSLPEPVFEKEIHTLADCAEATRRYIATGASTFREPLENMLTQISRMQKRKATLEGLLADKFSPTEMSYGRFQGTVNDVEHIMVRNVESTLHRIHAFDEDEYAASIQEAKQDNEIVRSKRALLNEYSSFMERSVENNEEILLRVDKLVLEISKLSEIHSDNLKEMDAMQEIDALINDAKWYK